MAVKVIPVYSAGERSRAAPVRVQGPFNLVGGGRHPPGEAVGKRACLAQSALSALTTSCRRASTVRAPQTHCGAAGAMPEPIQ